ncbi:cell surface protein [Candidatus Woesearchaeota archaeon]|nr:cell surface protein [Candidatus Woesearchaeota archaeon]
MVDANAVPMGVVPAPAGVVQTYLSQALSILKKHGFVGAEKAASQMVALLDDVKDVDTGRVLAIADTIQYMEDFNALVRTRIQGMDVGQRYQEITDTFDSIREDSKILASQLEDGEISWKEKAQQKWMQTTRGDPAERFFKIRTTYLKVAKDTNEQLDLEAEILEGYQQFRFAVKEAETRAYEVMAIQDGVMKNSQAVWEQASGAVTAYAGADLAEKSKLELARDTAQAAFLKQEKKYDLLKRVAENLKIGYNVGETLMAKLQQTHDVKEQVYTQGVTFFSTNEHVFTFMAAVYQSQHGLHEATQAMVAGANKGLEDVAQLGGKLEDAGLEVAYGATINAQSVQALVDSIVDFQTRQRGLIAQHREEATRSAAEVQRIVDAGKERYLDAVTAYTKPVLTALPQ